MTSTLLTQRKPALAPVVWPVNRALFRCHSVHLQRPESGLQSPAAAEVVDYETLSDDQWRSLLSPKQYSVLRKASTELPFSSPLNKEYGAGTFSCAGCSNDLFSSSAKFDSGTGWPSFFQSIPGAVEELQDNSIFFLPRTEVRCKVCHGHLGHVFDDGPPPTGLRYCMNGAALKFSASA